MNEKPLHLPMSFGEALTRIARVRKPDYIAPEPADLEKHAGLADNETSAVNCAKPQVKRKASR